MKLNSTGAQVFHLFVLSRCTSTKPNTLSCHLHDDYGSFCTLYARQLFGGREKCEQHTSLTQGQLTTRRPPPIAGGPTIQKHSVRCANVWPFMRSAPFLLQFPTENCLQAHSTPSPPSISPSSFVALLFWHTMGSRRQPDGRSEDSVGWSVDRHNASGAAGTRACVM